MRKPERFVLFIAVPAHDGAHAVVRKAWKLAELRELVECWWPECQYAIYDTWFGRIYEEGVCGAKVAA